MALLEIKTALVDLLTVQSLTGLSESQARLCVEDGRLAAFHLETRRSPRALIRVAATSLLDYLERRPPLGLDVDAWLDIHFQPNVNPRAAVVAHQLSCSTDHVPRLIQAGDLQAVPVKRPGRGVNASPAILRASLRTFLKARRIGLAQLN